MSNTFGNNIKVSIFGQSHSEAIGVSIDGLPAGLEVDMQALNAFLARRAPGSSKLATARKESDAPEFLSGIVEGKTCGAPVCAVIRNTNTRSKDYFGLKATPRPAHSDYAAFVKFTGNNDISGGGQFSGRLTAPLCIAGGIVKQLLKKMGIEIYAHVLSIGGVKDAPYNPVGPFEDVSNQQLCVIDDAAGERMTEAVLYAKAQGDSVGGVIECAAVGLPAGVGDPMFDGLENVIARAVFAIPAVKGIEFGSGFAAANMKGSEHNDGFLFEGDTVKTATNNHGGILGGISSGMPVIFRAAFKPTPSIAMEQRSVDLVNKCDAPLKIHGRHDPCIVPRAVPVVEAACALAIYDAILEDNKR